MDEAQLPPVSRLGRYLLIDELGRGGMGRVYRARDETLGREVAIKVLPPERRAPKRMAALRREARAMARLQHPNVVEIFTVGAEEGLVYIAMELVRGGDLRQWCTAAQRPAPEILARFIQAGRGLEAAHEAGIIHRDFKPSNVLVTRHGSVKVTDFGLARVWQGGPSDAVSQLTGDPHTADPEVTFTGSAIGTPTYMPPEQHRGDAADEQSDQYAFCVALWYALAGTSPFEGASSPEMLLLRKEQGPPPLPRRVAVPVTVADAIERGMMPRSHDRWPSMRELLAALERPSTPRRWGALALGGAVLAAAMALTLDSTAQDPSACSLEDLEASWKGQRAEVEDAFSAANIETATGERTMKALDEYAQMWMALRDDACESAVARGCLQERGAAFSALVHTFADGDELQGDLLLASVSKLPSPQTCASAEAPSQTKHPQVLLVEAMLAAGRYDGALSEAEALLADPNLGDTPRADAQYLRGELLAKMERTDDALEVLDVAYFAASNAGRNETAFHAAVRLAFLHQEMRHDFERARTWLDQARAAAKRLGSPPRLLALLDNAEGTFAESQGRYDDAEQAFARSLEWHREAGSPQTALAPAYNNRASARAGQGDLAGAIEDTQRAVALFEEGLGFDHPNVLIALSNLTGYLHHANEYERELAACDRLDTLVLARFGKVHPEYAASLNQRGLALKRMGRLDEAERAIVQSIEIREQLGDDGPRAAIAWVNLGTMYLEQGRLEEAETWFVKGRETMESQLGATHPATAQVLGNVAQLRHAQGRLDEAEALLDRTVNDLGEALGPEHPGVAPFRAFRGRVRAEAGKTEAARADLEASLVALERAGGPEQDLALTKLALARLLRESSPERAQTLAKSAAEDFDRLEEEDEATAARALLDPS